MRDVSGLWQIWFSPADANIHYGPLIYMTFWLEDKIWDFESTGFDRRSRHRGANGEDR